jgi:hypothetical protein
MENPGNWNGSKYATCLWELQVTINERIALLDIVVLVTDSSNSEVGCRHLILVG